MSKSEVPDGGVVAEGDASGVAQPEKVSQWKLIAGAVSAVLLVHGPDDNASGRVTVAGLLVTAVVGAALSYVIIALTTLLFGGASSSPHSYGILSVAMVLLMVHWTTRVRLLRVVCAVAAALVCGGVLLAACWAVSVSFASWAGPAIVAVAMFAYGVVAISGPDVSDEVSLPAE